MAQIPLQEAAEKQQAAADRTEGEKSDELEPALIGRDVARRPQPADVPAY
jgi:hypothetical protein